MIFFRVRNVRLSFQSGEGNLALFGKLKAYYSAPVDDLSGMTVNLKDVDQWMEEARKAFPAAVQDVQEALKYFFSSLSRLSRAFEKVEVLIGSMTVGYDGSRFYRVYRLSTWIKQDLAWVRTPVILKMGNSLSRDFRFRLKRKRWSSSEVFARILKNHKADLRVLIIRHPDWKGAEKFQF